MVSIATKMDPLPLDLHLQVQSKAKSYMPAPYTPYTSVRVGAICTVVAIIFIVLGVKGYLTPSSLFLKSINLTKAISIPVTCVVLIGGAFIIIARALRSPHSGKFVGSSHWKPCVLVYRPKEGETKFKCLSGYLDISALDQTKSGEVFFHIKRPRDATFTACLAILGLPIYLVGVVVYYALRTLVIPFYILHQIRKEQKDPDRPLFEGQRRFSYMDIPKEMLRSIERMLEAPFYATAFLFASLYALVAPMNGIKLGGLIESDWNRHVPLGDGVWLMHFWKLKNWKWEGGGGPDHFAENGFYYAGSWQRFHRLIYENDKLLNHYNLEKPSKKSCDGVYADDF